MFESYVSQSFIVELILKYCSVEDVIALLRLNKALNKLISGSNYWEEEVKRCFPLDYIRIKKHSSGVRWIEGLNQLMAKNFYSVSREKRQLFLAVFEGDMSVIQTLTFKDMNCVDSLDYTLIECIAQRRHQPTMNHVFQTIILPEYMEDGFSLNTKKVLARDEGDVIYICSNGLNVLQYAARLNQAKFTQEELSHLNMNAFVEDAEYREICQHYCVSHGRPVSIAARYGHLDAIKVMVGLGAEVDFPTNGDKSEELPLVKAVSRGNIQEVKFLLSSGARLGVAVCVAARHGQWEVFKLLVETGQAFEPMTKYNDGSIQNRLIHSAVLGGNCEILEAVIQMNLSSIDVRGGFGETALHCAVEHRQLAMFDKLIALGADPRLTDDDGRTSLDYAKRDGNITFIRKVYESLINRTLSEVQLSTLVPNYRYFSPLHEAVMFWSQRPGSDESTSQMIQTLLDQQADVNEQNVFGQTPLYIAISCQQPLAIIKQLLDCGANPTIATFEGETALHAAINFGYGGIRVEVVELLIQYGAVVNAVSLLEETPLHRCVGVLLRTGKHNTGDRNNCYACIKLLINHGARVSVLESAYDQTRNRHLGLIIAQLYEGCEGVRQNLFLARNLYRSLGLNKDALRLQTELSKQSFPYLYAPTAFFSTTQRDNNTENTRDLSPTRKYKM